MPYKEKFHEEQCIDVTCQKEIYPFTAKEPLHHWQWVQQCPEDSNMVMPWNGVDAECRIGYVKCPVALKDCPDLWVQEGKCVDVVIHRDWGGTDMGCKASGWVCDESGQTIWFEKGPKGDIKYYCDPTGTEEVTPVGKLQPAGGSGSRTDFEMTSGWVCDSEGTLHYFVKEVILDSKTGGQTHQAKYYTGVDCLTPSTPVGPTQPARPKELKETIIETRKITLLEGVETTLDPIPTDATGAEITFEGDPCCSFRATWDGSPAANGTLFTEGGCIALGCTTEAQSDPIELTNFKVIAEDDCEGCIRVSFYKQS